MIYELALVEDKGAYWKVTNVTKNTLDSLALKNESAIKLSYMAYKLIEEAILKGDEVRLPKVMQTDEVLPGEIEIVEVDSDDIGSIRNAAIVRIRTIMSPMLGSISGVVSYGFIVLNNELVSKGYAIYDGNREEVYLQILETGDDDLISKLETYLNYKDELARVSSLERGFSGVIAKIKALDTQDEIDTLTDEYITEVVKLLG